MPVDSRCVLHLTVFIYSMCFRKCFFISICEHVCTCVSSWKVSLRTGNAQKQLISWCLPQWFMFYEDIFWSHQTSCRLCPVKVSKPDCVCVCVWRGQDVYDKGFKKLRSKPCRYCWSSGERSRGGDAEENTGFVEVMLKRFISTTVWIAFVYLTLFKVPKKYKKTKKNKKTSTSKD